jgi:hypothetical protein
MHTDSSSESEFEIEVSTSSSSSSNSSDVETSKNSKFDFFSKLVDEEVKKLNVTSQIDNAIKKLTRDMDTMMPDVENIERDFIDVEKMVDEMRENLYRPFRPVPQFLEPLDLNDAESVFQPPPSPASSGDSPRSGVVAKRSSQPLRFQLPLSQPEIQVTV